jgi:hypothetical protein
MIRRMPWLLALAALAATAALAAAGSAAAAGTTQLDGVQSIVSLGDPFDATDDVLWMDGYGDGRPALIGYWYVRSIAYTVFTPSGVITGTGTEEFDGCLDANGDGSCQGAEPDGTLNLSFSFSSRFDLTFALVHGRCQHPVTGGTGDFAGATGAFRFKDDPVTGCAYYSGHLTLAG